MSPINLLPGIVWALDEVALKLVRRWQAGLSEKARSVFRVASCWEEFSDHLKDYRRNSFDETMLAAGLSLATQRQGRRINLVIVACLPPAGVLTWAKVEEKIATLQLHTITLEQHRVLLHPTLPEILAPEALDAEGIAPLRFLPWLLTRVVTGGFTLGEEEFYAHFSSLLDALFLAEREGGTVPGHLVGQFFHQPAQPGHVRLAGFSRISLATLLGDLARSLAQGTLSRAERHPYDATLVQNFERKIAQWLAEFQAGQRTSLQVEELLIQEIRRLDWPTAALLKEIPRIFNKETIRLQREPTVDQPQGNIFIRIWQRLRTWYGFPPSTQDRGPDSLQQEAVFKNLTRMTEVLQEMAELSRANEQLPANLPPELFRAWSANLQKLLIRRLERRWSDYDLVNRLAWHIEQDLARHFGAALFNWEVPNENVREVAGALQEGNLLRFSAPLRGGLPTRAQALVTSLNLGDSIRHGAQQVACTSLRLYPGRPPLLLAASEPVPVEHISL